MRVDAAEDVVFQTVFAKETREMHAKEARQSERQREKKERREEKDDKEKRRARDDLRFQTRTAAFARDKRKRESGENASLFP